MPLPDGGIVPAHRSFSLPHPQEVASPWSRDYEVFLQMPVWTSPPPPCWCSALELGFPALSPALVPALQRGLRLFFDSVSWSGCLAEGTELAMPVSHSTADGMLQLDALLQRNRLTIQADNTTSGIRKTIQPQALGTKWPCSLSTMVRS